MPAPKAILDLVDLFETSIDVYRAPSYKEAHLRHDFLDKFFEALGWDVNNQQALAPTHQEVIHEDSLKIGGNTKAPDYAFRIGGKRKFFVEAKQPAVNIEDRPEPAHQLRRYTWTAKLPLSILTDFEEFAIYDCRFRPSSSDKATTARILYLRYTDYEKRWDEIAEVFSKDAVLAGGFDKYAERTKALRGTVEVDDEFLVEIESWRSVLAHNLALRNRELTIRDLNFAVQQIIDRIVFLRICEDRGIERYGRLMGLQNGVNTYGRLRQQFFEADKKYNSGLFYFYPDKKRTESQDTLTPSLKVDDDTIKEIIRRLYYPESPYEFSVLPADILGKVYERFLGKVIRLERGRSAVVEDKPDVKKAGGVYYTPTYVVDHIVNQTLGKLCEGKSPKQVAALKVIDPACGSGSFLIAAYQHLLDWHRDWYVAHDPQKQKDLQKIGKYDWRLKTAARKRILVHSIFGLDIDPQAVEVAKLSLMLKMLEGESDESLKAQLRLFQERALPDLGKNLRCGNSLIGADFNDQLSKLDEDTLRRVNVFDWASGFPSVMAGRNSGFDAVIGNPPYVNIRTMQDWAPEEAEYYKTRYTAASKGSFDVYVVFVEKGLSLLNANGRLGYILPSKFFSTDYGEPLRDLLARSRAVSSIVDFGSGQVFMTASTYTALLFLSKIPVSQVMYSLARPPQAIAGVLDQQTIKASALTGAPWVFGAIGTKTVLAKLAKGSRLFGDISTDICRGSSTGADTVFVLTKTAVGLATRDGADVEIERDVLRVPLYATDFGRYRFSPSATERIIFPYRVTSGGYSLLSESDLKSSFPKAYAYLKSRKKALEARKQFKEWYGFSAPRSLETHDRAQLVVPLLADRGQFAELPLKRSTYCIMASGGFSISLAKDFGTSSKYLLGLLNSRLLFWHLRQISNIFRGGYITCTKQFVEKLPIKTIGAADRKAKAHHDSIVSLVDRILAHYHKLNQEKNPQTVKFIEQQISAAERQIDQEVYTLYGLTKTDVDVVEADWV